MGKDCSHGIARRKLSCTGLEGASCPGHATEHLGRMLVGICIWLKTNSGGYMYNSRTQLTRCQTQDMSCY